MKISSASGRGSSDGTRGIIEAFAETHEARCATAAVAAVEMAVWMPDAPGRSALEIFETNRVADYGYHDCDRGS